MAVPAVIGQCHLVQYDQQSDADQNKRASGDQLSGVLQMIHDSTISFV
jgi:hypothetical protein